MQDKIKVLMVCHGNILTLIKNLDFTVFWEC